MASKRDRVFILVIVGAFVIATVGTSVALIWSIISEKKNGNTPEQVQTDAATNTTTENNNSNALKGKQMQNFTPVDAVGELQVIDLQEGSGETVPAGANVTVDYTGAIATTGKVFESSLDTGQQATFGLDQVITGWKEGLVGMKVGGTRRLIIPAEKAYGAQSPSADIPANSALVFDIVLHKINK
jgi:FKBP-type peptidyl-prolyl cis-trans isomerase